MKKNPFVMLSSYFGQKILYINFNHVLVVLEHGDTLPEGRGASIVMFNNVTVNVRETPEQVIAIFEKRGLRVH